MENLNKDLILREKLAIERTYMANQTTFLSFLRTSMYFFVAGLTIGNLLKTENTEIMIVIFFSISFILLFTGVVNFIVHHRWIKRNTKHVGNYKMEYIKNKDGDRF